jgi:hypothetical protein
MPEDWTIEFEGFEFAPIPESWLDHPHAEDCDRYDGPRLFAVSAATYGSRTLKVRYAESRTGEVLVLQLPAQRHNGGVVPQGLLTGEGWTRSRYPPPRIDPMDLLRPVEEEHLQELWAGRGLLSGETQRRAVADGGDGRC